MEPANLNPHQQQYAGYYSSLLFQPEYKSSSTNHINPGNFLECWPPNYKGSNMCESLMGLNDASANELLLAKIKEEMPDSFPKLSEIMYPTTPNYNAKQESHSLSTKNNKHHPYYYYYYSHDDENIFSSGHRIQLSAAAAAAAGELNSSSDVESSSASCRYDFSSHLLPSLSISNMLSNSLDLNLQAVDLLAAKYDEHDAGSTQQEQAAQNNLAHYFIGDIKDSPSSSSNKTTVFVDMTQRKKRPINISESNNFLLETKRHKPSTSSSCPPLKKEKIRERVATLQRLIAPYGKTDTASVLTETIGYIQFLHDQVQTLSVPYMRSYNNQTKTTPASLREENGKEQPKRDLLSKGLCLVPLSYASFFNSYNGGI